MAHLRRAMPLLLRLMVTRCTLNALVQVFPTRDPDIHEIVACDVVGLRLKRRWSISSPRRFGESTPILACAADGALFALRRKYSGSNCKATVQRFAPRTKKILSEAELVGEPGSMAVNFDGSQVALSMSDGTVFWLKDELKVVERRKLKQKLWPIQFVGRQELLGACVKGMFRVDADFRVEPSLATSLMLTSSPWTTSRKLCAVKKRKDELSFQIFSYPALETDPLD